MRFAVRRSADLPDPEPAGDSDELSDDQVGNVLDPLPALDPGADDDDDTEEGVEVPVAFLADTENAEDDSAAIDVGSDESDLLELSETVAGADDDAEGPPDVDLVTIEDPADSDSDDAEGLDDPALFGESLPPLEGREDTEGLDEETALPELAALGDEPRPPFADSPYEECGPSLELEACGALSATDGVVVAASTDLFWFGPRDSSPLRLEAGSSRIHAVTLVGTGLEYAVCSTASGKLFRRGRLSSASDELRRVREAADLLPSSRQLFDLCQPGAAFPHTLLVRTAAGKLLRSDDDGTSFRALDDNDVVALAATGTPIYALSARKTLLRSEDGGGAFTELALTGIAEHIAEMDGALVAGNGTALALAHAALGLVVSRDAGSTFVRVAGTQGVTAVCCGEQQGTAVFFAALYDDTRNRSSLVRVPVLAASAARTLAIIELPSSDEDAAETARISALVWEGSEQRLWVAGGFGVKVYAPTSH